MISITTVCIFITSVIGTVFTVLIILVIIIVVMVIDNLMAYSCTL